MSKVHIKENFAYQNLSSRNFDGHDFFECDFRHTILRHAHLADVDLHRSDLRGARLDGITLTMNCFTFLNVKFDRDQINEFLFLLTLADIDPVKKNQIIEVIGNRKFDQLRKAFKQE